MAARQFRVAGSRFTAFEYNGQFLLTAQEISHVAPQPVAQSVAIQPIDSVRPVEIITPGAIGMGTLGLRIYEVYGRKVWDDLAGLTGATDLADVFQRVASLTTPIKVKKYVFPPAGSKVQPYYDLYNNCVISNIDDSEVIEIGTMQVMKNVTINYTHTTRSVTDADAALGTLVVE